MKQLTDPDTGPVVIMTGLVLLFLSIVGAVIYLESEKEPREPIEKWRIEEPNPKDHTNWSNYRRDLKRGGWLCRNPEYTSKHKPAMSDCRCDHCETRRAAMHGLTLWEYHEKGGGLPEWYKRR